MKQTRHTDPLGSIRKNGSFREGARVISSRDFTYLHVQTARKQSLHLDSDRSKHGNQS